MEINITEQVSNPEGIKISCYTVSEGLQASFSGDQYRGREKGTLSDNRSWR